MAIEPEIDPGDKLQKVLATAGIGSRRQMEGWIQQGRVLVNAEVAHLGQRVTVADRIEVDGKRVRLTKPKAGEILVMNKAGGLVCTRRDPEGRSTIFDELPSLKHGRWISVGRLDIQTSGLLLLTNDGDLANKLTHPSTGLDREYAVRINRRLEESEIKQLIAGLEIDGEKMQFSDIRYYNGSEKNVWYHVALLEGKNREVRRLFEAVDCTVSRLKRVRYGPVILPSWLRNGQWASMGTSDVRQIYKLLGMRYTSISRSPGKASKMAKTSCLLPYPKLLN